MIIPLIRGARLIDPASGLDEVGDVLIEGGKIAAVGGALEAPGDALVYEAEGKVLAPALIDMHVRVGEPGGLGPEPYQTTLRAAAAGGIGALCLAAESGTGIDTPEIIEWFEETFPGRPVSPFIAALAVRDGALGPGALLADAGAALLSAGAAPLADADLARRAMLEARLADRPILLRPEDPILSARTCAWRTDAAERNGLAARPAISERLGAQRDVALAELTGARLIMDRIATAEGVAVLKAAKARGLDVAASVAISHLTFNEVDAGGLDPRFRLEPPLGTEADRQALIAAVCEGIIDAVVSDHHPLAPEAKDEPFALAAPGSANLEALLPALCALVESGALSLLEALAPVTASPAELLGLTSGRLKVGAPADLIVFDPSAPLVYGKTPAVSKAPSAYAGRRLFGRLHLSVLDGVAYFHGDQERTAKGA